MNVRRGRPSGYLITTPLDGGAETVQETRVCCHCGHHWVYRPGSGQRRGVCVLCNGHTCGRPECDACVPLEQLIENIEHNRPLNHRPVRVSVGAKLPSCCAGGIELCTNASSTATPAASSRAGSPPARAA